MDWPCWEMDEGIIDMSDIHPKPTEFTDAEVADEIERLRARLWLL